MNVSFTRKELDVLWSEICAVVESADMCIDEGRPRADDAVLRNLKEKIGRAREDADMTPEVRRLVRLAERVQDQLREAAGESRHSKWDRFREVQP